MASYVIIDYDTTPPILSIYAPNFTTKEIDNYITIESNEPLAEYQEIYTIDGIGERREYTFSRIEENKLEGIIRFTDYPLGIVTIYARLKDIADNTSNVISYPIHIKETLTALSLKINDEAMRIDTEDKVMKIEVGSE